MREGDGRPGKARGALVLSSVVRPLEAVSRSASTEAGLMPCLGLSGVLASWIAATPASVRAAASSTLATVASTATATKTSTAPTTCQTRLGAESVPRLPLAGVARVRDGGVANRLGGAAAAAIERAAPRPLRLRTCERLLLFTPSAPDSAARLLGSCPRIWMRLRFGFEQRDCANGSRHCGQFQVFLPASRSEMASRSSSRHTRQISCAPPQANM